MQAIIDAVSFLASWFDETIYQFFVDMIHYTFEFMAKFIVQFLAWMVPFVWGIAKGFIQDLQLSTSLINAWGTLDGDAASMAVWFGVPEAMNNILAALALRFAIKAIPGL